MFLFVVRLAKRIYLVGATYNLQGVCKKQCHIANFVLVLKDLAFFFAFFVKKSAKV